MKTPERIKRSRIVGILAAIVWLAGLGSARGQLLDWVTQTGETWVFGGPLALNIAVDGNGDSYVAGHSFIARYDAAGAAVWVKHAVYGDDASIIDAIGIAVDGSGNVHVIGFFGGTVTLGQGEPNETTLTTYGGFPIPNVFVATYDGSGQLLWVKRIGGAKHQIGLGIAVDGGGNSYITGTFGNLGGDGAIFGEGEPNQTQIAPIGSADIFVAKYDANGHFVWVKTAGDLLRTCGGTGIALDGTGNIYVTGKFNDFATFGRGEPNETTIHADDFDIFLAKYDATGQLIWARPAGGGAGSDKPGIAVDRDGNGCVIGTQFLSRFDAAGQAIWTLEPTYAGKGVAVDGSGNCYATGVFGGDAGDTATFDETVLTSEGQGDAFVAEYDADGHAVWAKRAGGEGTDVGFGIAVDDQGNSYVTGIFGAFGSAAIFGAGEPNETTLTAPADRDDVFVAKFTAATPTPTVLSVVVTGSQSYGSASAVFTTSTAPPADNTFTGTLTCTNAGQPIDAALPAGSYTIDGSSCSGLALSGPTAGDYSIVYSGSTFTVSPAPLTVNAPSANANVGAVPATFTPTYIGLQNGQSAPATPATCTSNATNTSHPGTYAITCSGAADANYAISYGPAGTLTIAKAPTTLTAAPAKKKLLSLTMSATLKRTDNAAPIAGKRLTFSVANAQICQATTNSSGVASCSAGLAIVIGRSSYTATFAGDGDYVAASDNGSL